MIVDYYRILRVPPEADFDTIKKAYRARALECHPDRGGSHEAMLEINEAFEILANSEARRRYDEARRNQFDQTALEEANADAAQARQEAENYPRDWNEFESWLDRLTKDFTNAKYGKHYEWPTVSGSVSGWVFIIGGGIAGALTAFSLFPPPLGSSARGVGGAGALAGAWIGKRIHQFIGKSLQSSRATASTKSTDSSTGSSIASSELVSCPRCGQQLRAPSEQIGIHLRCPKCRFEFSPPGQPQNGGATSGTVAADDKAMGYAFVTAIVSGIIFYNSCSNTTRGDLFTSATTEPNWPAIIVGTLVCAFIAYGIGKKPSGPANPPAA
jgi:curved DNA-binding protein CbpA